MSDFHLNNLLEKLGNAGLLTCEIEEVLSQYFTSLKNQKKISTSTPLAFGKYKGKSLNEIKTIDSNYYTWAKQNLRDKVDF